MAEKKRGGRGRARRIRVGGFEALRFRLFRDCLEFGCSLDPAAADEAEGTYRRFAGRSTGGARAELLSEVASTVEEGVSSVAALLPFILFEEKTEVIQQAALESALLMPLKDGDPMTGPLELFRIAREMDDDRIRAAVLAGILLLGDRRALPLVRDAWRVLGDEGRKVLTDAWSGYAFASMIEFYLDWMEDGAARDTAGIAAALARMPDRSVYAKVVSVERVFPVTASPLRPVRVLGEWDFDEFGALLAHKLRDLHRRENEPKVIHRLFEAWGLPPP